MTKKTLASLSKQFKLSDAEMREVICQRYRRLQTAPSRLDKVEAWITKWTNFRYDMIALNIDMISESQMSHDFLKAGAKWAHDFRMLWPIVMRSAKKEMKFLDTTSEYRDEIIRIQISSTDWEGVTVLVICWSASSLWSIALYASAMTMSLVSL